MNLIQGFPPINKIAVADTRYVHFYNYSTHLNSWILILEATVEDKKKNVWTFVRVDQEYGAPIGAVETTSIDLWNDRFAVRPFDVLEDPEEDRIWFERLALRHGYAATEVDELLSAYMQRRAWCSSQEALTRIGITPKLKGDQNDAESTGNRNAV